MENTHDHSQ